MFLFFLHYALSLHFAEVIFRVTDFFIHAIKFKKLKKMIVYNIAIDTQSYCMYFIACIKGSVFLIMASGK